MCTRLLPCLSRFCHSHLSSEIPNLPAKTYLLMAPQTVDIRPPAPPVPQTLEDLSDPFHTAVTSDGPLDIEAGTLKRFREAQTSVKETQHSTEDVPGRDVTIFPLGTGSALPTKYRNGQLTLVLLNTTEKF